MIYFSLNLRSIHSESTTTDGMRKTVRTKIFPMEEKNSRPWITFPLLQDTDKNKLLIIVTVSLNKMYKIITFYISAQETPGPRKKDDDNNNNNSPGNKDPPPPPAQRPGVNRHNKDYRRGIHPHPVVSRIRIPP